MRYWISRTEGEVDGPFETSELQRMLDAGECTKTTQVCAEGTEHWQSIESVLANSPPPPKDATAPLNNNASPLSNLPASRYTYSKAFGLGWKVFKSRYGLLLAITMTAIGVALIPQLWMIPINIFSQFGTQQGSGNLAASVIVPMILGNCFAWIWNIGVQAPIIAGCFLIAVNLARGRDATFKDIFVAYHRFGWYLIAVILGFAVVIGIEMGAIIIGAIPGLIVGFGVGFASVPEAGVISGIIVGTICAVILIFYFVVRVMWLSILVIDEQVGYPNPAEALVANWKATCGHAWSLVGLIIVLILIVSGSAMCFILPVLFFAYPLGLAVMGAAYALLFPVGWDGKTCPECGYTRAQGAGATCTECGAAWPSDGTVIDS